MMPRLQILAIAAALLSAVSAAVAAEGAEEEPLPPFERLEPLIQPGHDPGDVGIEASLWMVFEEAELDTRTSPKRIRDEEISDYLYDITCNLAPDYCPDIRVYLVQVPYFNASMAPNGMMSVWTGLLLRVENEAQLAAVLGHELGHYLRLHGIDRFKALKNRSMVAGFFALGLGVAGYGDAAELTNLIITATLFRHSRNGEREADQYGIQLVADAGYDPREIAKVWHYIEEENLATQSRRKKKALRNRSVFFATHPKSENRADTLEYYARQLIAENNGDTGTLGRDRFNKIVGPYRQQMLEDQLDLQAFGETLYVLDKMIEQGTAIGLATYYKGEIYRIRDKKGDSDRALELYRRALAYDDRPADAQRAIGLELLKREDVASAKRYFAAYLAEKPDADDRAMIEYYMAMEE